MMSRDEFKRQQEIAQRVVQTWPEWKQNLLENSAKPTVNVARTPVVSSQLKVTQQESSQQSK